MVTFPAMSTSSSNTHADKRKDKHGLNAQQRIFVLAVLEGANSTEAARKAGYSDPNYGRQLITKGNVSAAVEEGRLDMAMRGDVTQDWLVEREKEILAHALTPIRALDRYGKPTGPEMRQLSAANTAVFNLAKLCGFWVDKRADAPPNLAEELFRAIGARPMKLIEHDPEDEAKE